MSAVEERALLWIGYAVIVAIVFLSLFLILNKMSNSTYFEQEYYAKEMALIEHTLLANDFNHYTSKKVGEKYEFIFEDCRVTVNEKDTVKFSGSHHFCADNSQVKRVVDMPVIYDTISFTIKDDILKIFAERSDVN